VINAFPVVRSQADLDEYPRRLLRRRFGRLGDIAHRVPGVRQTVWRRVTRRAPGDIHTFVARKPGPGAAA
jgi:hypothetical protein